MESKIKFYIDSIGRSCNGCTRCCEGWLTTKVFNFEIGPEQGPCRFLGKGGCSIYEQRQYDPCQTFQCGWKENTSIPEDIKPSKSNVILLLRYIAPYHFYRMVKCGEPLDSTYAWAKEYARNGGHLVGYDKGNNLQIFSEDRKFRELARKNFPMNI
jgi:Fe-S-cluster containining protein